MTLPANNANSMSANAPVDLQLSARMALRCLDLTSLNDYDTAADVTALCARAQTPYGFVAAVCIWPQFVSLARSLLPSQIMVAAVANFPSGEMDVARTLEEVKSIVAAGADEVDVVFPYRALQLGQTRACANFLAQIRIGCGPRTALKVIIESGELNNPAHIVRATRLAIAAGADFVKTSTGKTPVSATPEAASVMLGEISRAVGRSVGFKSSGGIRTVADAQTYISLTTEQLGPQAIVPDRFRIGASSILNDILAVLSDAGGAVTQTAPPGNNYPPAVTTTY